MPKTKNTGALESEKIAPDTWRYPALNIRVTAASKEDADRRAMKVLASR